MISFASSLGQLLAGWRFAQYSQQVIAPYVKRYVILRFGVLKFFLFIFLVLNTYSMNANEFDNLIIEVKNEGLFVDKKVVNDLEQYIQDSFDCRGKVILMIHKNIEHKKIPIIMDMLKSLGCEKISIAAV
jgi:hypothetical protein